MKLIAENLINNNGLEIILEQQNPNLPKVVKIKGPYAVSETKNQNGRQYKEKILDEAVNTYIKESVLTNKMSSCGELNHPPTIKINPERIVHKVNSLTKEKNVWIGESTILTGSPLGDLVASHLQHGLQYGISTRGVGEINEDNIIDKDYRLICFDLVIDPSGTLKNGDRCFVDGILESKNYIVNQYGEILEQVFDEFQNKLSNIPTHSIKTDVGREFVIKAIENFINNI